KLGDFGVANRNLGTILYMPPEMLLLGERVSRLDPRVDVYALGLTLLESITGQHRMALPEFLTLYSQLLSGEAPWLHEPPILLRSAFAGAGFDAAGAVVDLMGGDGQEQPDVELLAPLPPRVQ